jgi:signal transduction histidine kinase
LTEVETTASIWSLTAENERLRAELSARLAELRACRARMLEAAEATRKRIERNLHDGTQQRLVSLAMSLGLLDAKLPAEPDAARTIAGQARQALAVALEELRELSQGVYPSVLAERGLMAALEELCERAVPPARLEISLDPPTSGPVAAATYFAVSEMLTNVAKHAHASTVHVLVAGEKHQLTFEVSDDGIGGAVVAGGSGLRGLTDRIEGLGGRLTISSPLWGGTTIRGEFPTG